MLNKTNKKLNNIVKKINSAPEFIVLSKAFSKPSSKISSKGSRGKKGSKRSTKIHDKALLEVHANIKEIRRELKVAPTPRIRRLLKSQLRENVRHLNKLISKLSKKSQKLPRNSLAKLHLTINKLRSQLKKAKKVSVKSSLKKKLSKVNKRLQK
jgi:hypothetical protein